MTKDQIDEIAFKVARESNLRLDNACGCSTCRERDDPPRIKSFTHALLAELAKVQEPVAMYCGYNPSMGHVFRADAVIEVGTYLYTQPLPQPDLDAEQDKGTTDAQLDSDSNDSRPVELRKLDGPVEMGQLLGNSQNSETGNPKAEGEFPLSDSFRGDNDQLIASIKALLELDADNALVPHGLGGHARVLLTACACRLLQQPDLVAEIERLKEQYVRLQLAQASKVAELRQQLSEAQSRIELLEHDAKTGDYETLYAQTVVELSAAQASEADLLEALETLACLGNGDIYGNSHGNVIAQKAITTHKARKEGK